MPLLGDVKDKKILDVGAGTGRLALRLAKLGAEVMALDVSEEMIKKIKKDLKITPVSQIGGRMGGNAGRPAAESGTLS